MYETFKKLVSERDEMLKTLVTRMQEMKQEKVLKADDAKPSFTFNDGTLGKPSPMKVQDEPLNYSF